MSGTGPLSLRPGWRPARTPAPVLAAVAVFVAIGVLVALTHRPTGGQRAGDLHAFATGLRTDIASCAGGLRQSLAGLAQTSSDPAARTAALAVARDASAACAPDQSTLIYDLDTTAVPQSLKRLHLDAVVRELTQWSFPLADRLDVDLATLLSSPGPATASAARADFARVAARLVATGKAAQHALDAAAASLHAAPVNLDLPAPTAAAVTGAG